MAGPASADDRTTTAAPKSLSFVMCVSPLDEFMRRDARIRTNIAAQMIQAEGMLSPDARHNRRRHEMFRRLPHAIFKLM
jgi:hypothetical protein